jgi:hypothetical protein
MFRGVGATDTDVTGLKSLELLLGAEFVGHGVGVGMLSEWGWKEVSVGEVAMR